MILGLLSADGGMTVGLWRLSSLDGRRPPWYRLQGCVVQTHNAIQVCAVLSPIFLGNRVPNSSYDPQKDQINTLGRRTQTTIFRLRTGHCGLRKRLKKLGLADSAHCECGSEEQTPEHILQTCPHLETVRQQFWPEDTEVGTKLWGQTAELQRTSDFLAATGMRI